MQTLIYRLRNLSLSSNKITGVSALKIFLGLGVLAGVFSPLGSAAPTDPNSPPNPAGGWNNQPSWTAGPPPANEGQTRQSRRRSSKEPQETNIQAFGPGSNNVAIDVGQIFLMGNLGDSYQNALGFRAHYTYGVSDIFGFDSSLGYSSHSDGKFSVMALTSGVRANLTWYDRIVPYAIAGLGFYRPSIDITPSNSVSAMLFGLHLGPGVDLLLTKQIYFGASLTFHDIFGSTKQTERGPVELGGTFTAFFIHAGMAF